MTKDPKIERETKSAARGAPQAAMVGTDARRALAAEAARQEYYKRLAEAPWGECYKRFIAADVETGKRSKDHPEAVALRASMGRSFDALREDVRAIRKHCGIPEVLKAEYAELVAMQGLANDEYIRGLKAALEGERAALDAAAGAARIVDKLNGKTASVRSRALAAQLLDVRVKLSVFPAKGKKKAQLAASEEVARKVRAQHVGVRLAELGVSREAAAKYLMKRGFEKKDILLKDAIENQRSREKRQKLRENSPER